LDAGVEVGRDPLFGDVERDRVGLGAVFSALKAEVASRIVPATGAVTAMTAARRGGARG
jgi:hypothetical protein